MIDDPPQVQTLEPTLAAGLPLHLDDEAVGVSRNPAVDCLNLLQSAWLESVAISVLHHFGVVVPAEQKPSVSLGHGSECHAVAAQENVVGTAIEQYGDHSYTEALE